MIQTDAAAQRQPRNEMRTRTQLLLLLAGTGVLVVVVAAVVAGIWLFAWHASASRSEWGTCHSLAGPPQCSGVPLSSLEKFSGLALPAGSRVAASSSTGRDILGGGSVDATVALPPHALSPLADQIPSHANGGTKSFNTNTPAYSRQITESTDEHGQTVIQMHIHVNGP